MMGTHPTTAVSAIPQSVLERSQSDSRPGLAFVANSHTPYREHLHRRVAREIPELRLWSIFTHETSGSGTEWAFEAADEINPISFGRGQAAAEQDRLRYAAREWRKAGAIIRFVLEHDIRAVVVNGYNDLGRVRILRWCRVHEIPCFVWADSNIRGDRATGLRRVIKNVVLPRILRLPRGVLACGQLGKAYFKRYGVAADRIFLFPLEPDYDAIQRVSPSNVEDVRSRFQLTSGRRRIVYSGRLSPEKLIDQLIDAFAAIAPARPQWDLLLIGGGELRHALAERVPSSLAERVRFVGFLKDQADVSALYRLSDVLALTSLHDAWALVINEAAASGLAIVSSDVVGAAADLVRDGVNGRLFAPADLQGLTAALLEATDNAVVDRMKAASPQILAEWRRLADPVRGLREALYSCGVLGRP